MEIDEDRNLDVLKKSRSGSGSKKLHLKANSDDSFKSPTKNSENDEQSFSDINATTPFKLEVSASSDENESDSEEFVSVIVKKEFEKKILQIKERIQKNKEKKSKDNVRFGFMSDFNSEEEFTLGFDETGLPQSINDKTFALECMTFLEDQEAEQIMSEIEPIEIDKIIAAIPDDFSEMDLPNPFTNLSNKGENSTSLEENNTTTSRVHIDGDSEDLKEDSTTKDETKNGNSCIEENSFMKPFDFGWKREVVWRIHPSGKEKADIYYISPSGKKLRSRNELTPFIAKDKEGLKIDDFSFAREPLGLSEEFEIVRQAKNLSRSSLSLPANNDNSTSIGKRVSKPKVPKGASPPPEDWTPTKALKMNNTALQTGRNPSTSINTTNTSSPSSLKRSHSQQSTPAAAGSSSSKSKSKKTSKTLETPLISTSTSASNASSAATASSTKKAKKVDICQGNCLQPVSPSGQVKCKKCLRLYHLECVDLSPENCEFKILNEDPATNETKKDFVCETCLMSSSSSSSSKKQNSLDKKDAKRKEDKEKSSHKISTSRADLVSPPVLDFKYPQTLAVVKGKKYVMISKPIITSDPRETNNDDMKKTVVKSIRNIKKSRTSVNDSGGANNIPIVPSLINSNQQFAANFFSNVSSGYDCIINILKYLKIHERSRAASVCKLWNLATKDPTFWRTVRMKNSKVCDWNGFAAALRRGETKHLDLRKMLLSPSSRSDEAWLQFLEQIGTVGTLEAIDMCRCTSKAVETIFRTNKKLRILNALALNDNSIDLENIRSMKNLEELRLHPVDYGKLKTGLHPLQSLHRIKHLSLTGFKNLGAQGIEILGSLTSLKSLELGECGQFENSFAKSILPKLKNLVRLRLENNQYGTCETTAVVKAVASMPNLQQLELVNFDIKPGFDTLLADCTNLKKLLVIPTYISQSATTNNIVLSAVQKVSKTLENFTWGVTIELLRVTALYVDQCDGSSKKDKQQFDECIPVLKPVPGANNYCDDDQKEESIEEETESDVPQIEILPLDRVEAILANTFSNTTSYHIVKIPYHATYKQHLVE